MKNQREKDVIEPVFQKIWDKMGPELAPQLRYWLKLQLRSVYCDGFNDGGDYVANKYNPRLDKKGE